MMRRTVAAAALAASLIGSPLGMGPASASVAAGAGPAGTVSSAATSAGATGAPLVATATKPRATISGTLVVLESGQVRITVTSNAKKVTLSYRTASGKKRSRTVTLRAGTATRTLARGSRSVKAQAKATTKLRTSPRISIAGPTAADPVAGGTYTVFPNSPVLSPMSGYSTLNPYTYAYYLIRSYMHRFEALGGGTLILGPGRYDISSTIYVPSNTTIRLSAGTTLVKSDKTGTSAFNASDSIFMFIRPSLGKVSGAVGGHDGDANITLAGAGGGQSVIDMAGVYNSLAIISGHNRGVTISGITFRNMNNNHFIEIDACADCSISGNEFLNSWAGTRETAEAINLDTPDPRTNGFGSVWSKQDSTPNERVTISGNRFDNMRRALGTHNFSAGRYHTDIVVRDNVITDNIDDAIHIMNWANPVITGNQISSYGGSVGIRACGTSNPTFTGNTFAGSGSAVIFRTCSGENGTTAPNSVNAGNAEALKANTVGAGLGSASVGVPGYGTVWFNGHEPPPGPPSAPGSVQVTPGDGQLTVTWTAGSADPRAPVSGYRVSVRETLTYSDVFTKDVDAATLSAVIPGLTNGTSYQVYVRALSSMGESSSASASGWSFTPVGRPGTPTGVTTTPGTTGTVHVSWTAPASNGGTQITGYTVTVKGSDGVDVVSPIAVGSYAQHTIAGLTPGSSVFISVAATNSVGTGPASTPVPVTVAGP